MNPLSEPQLRHKENIFLHLRRAVETIESGLSWAESPPVLWIIQQFPTSEVHTGSLLLARIREVKWSKRLGPQFLTCKMEFRTQHLCW